MNTANLQLQGLYLAIAAVNNALVAKGLLTREEVDLALREAETTSLEDYRADDLVAPNREAMAFAARFLRLVNQQASGGEMPSFSDIAKQVGETKKAPSALR
jgi:hypothetical protein